ncbi:hypothetical protein [Frondihabitans australicus]|uniref:Transposase n=1 Tax=Frondihabitans australicus TaxID=386892 RepID=A0A495IIJ8_9MICO|nr:hypothetical protein [Frondihabitans australicus]RKR75803.1 hypothetical protein C8E83_2959 [Frondihabitans australicus]
MPFTQKYDDATREAATARVLERRATNPDDRSVLRVVADEFNVGQQSLRAWVAEADGEQGVRKTRRSRPRFSPVVTTRIEPADVPDTSIPAIESAPAVAAVTPVVPVARQENVAESPNAEIASLEAEIESLRRGNAAITAAMRVLLAG